MRKTKYNTTEHTTTARKTTRKTTRLKRSKLEYLFRHANGVYWVRVKVNGKSKERSFSTTDYNLAASLLNETVKEMKGPATPRRLAHSLTPSKPGLKASGLPRGTLNYMN